MRAQSEGRLRVLVSLGGGPRVTAGLRIARAIADANPDTWVTLAAGFSARAARTTRHPRVRLLESPAWLRSELARVDVAVLAGGVTLYEAALLGVPTVALAVVAAQMPTIRAFERVGASIAAGWLPSRDRAAARTDAREGGAGGRARCSRMKTGAARWRCKGSSRSTAAARCASPPR